MRGRISVHSVAGDTSLTIQFLIDLPDDQARRLADLAAIRATTPEALLVGLAEALTADARALDGWIAEGEADLAAGRTIPFEDAMAEMDAIIASARHSRG
jgi:predicted transcriptional regulator